MRLKLCRYNILALILSVFVLTWGGGFKAEAAQIEYIKADGTKSTADAAAIITIESDKQLSAGWHYVTGDVTIGTDGGNALKLPDEGDVNLILCDGAKLKAKEITTNGDNSTASLFIYAQSTGNNAGTLEITVGQAMAKIYPNGNVTINGGNININSEGGSYIKSENGSVTINGGNITLNSTNSYILARGGGVTINGGTVNVTSTGSNSTAYIFSHNGSVTISGGTVNVTSTSGSAYIQSHNSSVTINGGTVNVTSTNERAYIQSETGSVTISGGQVTVTGQDTTSDKSGIICGGSGTITLGYTNGTDFILASGYYNYSDNDGNIWTAITPTIAAGKTFAVLTGDDFTTLEKVIDSSTSLKANELDGKKLVPILSVTFNANSGTGTMNPQTFVSGIAQALTANAFTRTGYTFKEWNTQQDGSGTSYADGAQVTLTENLTLYAQWTPASYTITYNLDGGTVTKANPTSYTAETETFTLNNPTKDGYAFTGWTGTDLKAAIKTVTITKGSTGNREYTANYSENQQSQTLTALNVSITGADSPYTTEGEAFTSAYTASVAGTYSDGSSKTLTASDYSLEWTLDKSISGVSINNGTLSVSDSALQGEYELTITAKATQGSITGSGVKNITLHVYKRRETTDASNLNSMTTEEKNAIEYLALSDNPNNKITKLSDVDWTDFTNLNTLDLSELKNLEEADLSQLPDNVKNVSLQNTNITSLNLNNSKVERVNAAGCKNLTDIDAEDNTSLTDLDVSDTSITSLNVKNCTRLQSLNCSSCDLEAGYLNLEGCSSLVSLDISKNHFGWFDYDESANSLNSFECYSQDITGWESHKTFSFTKFFNSGDVTTAGVEIMASAYVNNVYDISGYTESGDEIPSEYDPETGVAAFESAPAVIKYFYDTGFNNSSMDVTIRASSYDDEDNYLGDSGCGGCNAGLSFSSLIFAVFVFMFKFNKRH